eukprot:6285660-Pyramimonas_sp.AAC.1
MSSDGRSERGAHATLDNAKQRRLDELLKPAATPGRAELNRNPCESSFHAPPPVAAFDGDDRESPICPEAFAHRERFASLQCCRILRRAGYLQLVQNTSAHTARCPARRGAADVVADFRFIGADCALGCSTPMIGG